MRSITVNTKQRQYNVYFIPSLVRFADTMLRKIYKGTDAFVITDENVWRIHGEKLQQSLCGGLTRVKVITLPPGEQSKSLSVLEQIYYELVRIGYTRSDVIVAFGGGVIGDVAGFAAATYMRGIRIMQIPTTLVAQVDSCIGGKTAINLSKSKNIVGAFYQPHQVLIDVSLLETLDNRQFNSGVAEVIKSACVADAELFGTLCNVSSTMDWSGELDDVVYRCCCIKRDIVKQDEDDTSLRMLLNFGHTFGHALETHTDYKWFTHGEAVAYGMRISADIGVKLGITPPEVSRRLHALLDAFGLNAYEEPANLINYLSMDKKKDADGINFVLLEDIGSAVVKKLTLNELAGLCERDFI